MKLTYWFQELAFVPISNGQEASDDLGAQAPADMPGGLEPTQRLTQVTISMLLIPLRDFQGYVSNISKVRKFGLFD